MTDQHPITPPPKLVEQWFDDFPIDRGLTLAIQAARWGADQELEACRLWVSENHSIYDARDLRLARRPKPPSLKEQVLALIEQHEDGWRPSPKDWDTIRRALEALDD